MAFEWGLIASAITRTFDGWLKTRRVRRKLYAEATGIYRELVVVIRNIERHPDMEERFRGQRQQLTKAEYFRHVRGNIELFTDLDEQDREVIGKVFDAFLGSPAARTPRTVGISVRESESTWRKR